MIFRTSPADGKEVREAREDLSAAVSVSSRAAQVSSQARMIWLERD